MSNDEELTKALTDAGIEVSEGDDLRQFRNPDGSPNRLKIGNAAMDARIKSRTPAQGGLTVARLHEQAIETARRSGGAA